MQGQGLNDCMSETRDLYVVTGAGGFIGSHLVEAALRAGHRVRALVRYGSSGSHGFLDEVTRAGGPEAAARLQIVSGDITDRRCVRTLVQDAAVVFHLAALIGIPYSYAAPESYVHVNVLGTLNVLEAVRDAGTPLLVQTSTSEVYGTAVSSPMSEMHPLQAQSPYAASKIAADKLVESYIRSFALPAVVVRPFNTYGPRQSMRAVLPTIIVQALSPKVESIRLGSLDPVRDLSYVSDTVAGFLAVASAPREAVTGQTFNLGAGKGISIGNLAELVLEVLKIRKPVVEESTRQRPEASEVRLLLSDNRRMRNATGWRPEVNLDAGIRRTAAYIQENLARMNPAEYRR